MRLNPAQRDQLLNALNDVFVVKGDVARLVTSASNESLDQITLGSNLKEILFAVVIRAEEGEWLGRLLDEAIKMRPSAQPLHAVSDSLTPVIAAEREDHYAACWLLGDRALVDRQPLRKALSMLYDNASGKHILVVMGQPGTGRSHSAQMISYLEQRKGGFNTVWVDLSDLGAVGEVRPEDLGQAIVDQMGLSDMPERQQEQDARWSMHFCNWLTGQVKASNGLYWIVLDSFDKTLLPQGTHDLIRELAKRIARNLSQLRLVLLAYSANDKDSLPPDVFRGGFEEEEIARIGKDELLAFFALLYDKRKRASRVDFTPDDVANSVKTILQNVDLSSAGYLEKLSKAVVNEGRRIQAVGGPL